MRGAFGKPIGTVARVHIRQVMMSIRTRANHENSAIEAFRRAKFKFPGRQKIVVSNKFGFTKYTPEEYESGLKKRILTKDGVNVQYHGEKGPFRGWLRRMQIPES
eukprot:TRINITY_DN362_c0_g3_i2.p1 TRINITY_DN362_c0_g3~~TRINITY_DN362_c0_g3_i2.p1  ORF type:complete len:105 (-),score=18.21 TRINITY_DN362_c0_g3_i2:88-402(-)